MAIDLNEVRQRKLELILQEARKSLHSRDNERLSQLCSEYDQIVLIASKEIELEAFSEEVFFWYRREDSDDYIRDDEAERQIASQAADDAVRGYTNSIADDRLWKDAENADAREILRSFALARYLVSGVADGLYPTFLEASTIATQAALDGLGPFKVNRAEGGWAVVILPT